MISLEQQVREVKREIAMRERVYPRWISTNKLTQGTADAQLEAMRAVLSTLQGLQSEKEDAPLSF